MNTKIFFDRLKKQFTAGKLTQIQVDNINLILEEAAKYPEIKTPALAYILATIYHETAGTFRPVAEYGKGKGLAYGSKLKYGKGPGRRVPYTTPNHIFYGRGHTQNTWFENYEALTKAAQKAGYDWDFLNNPELLLTPGPSVWATFYAMSTGLYTGRKLSDYFGGGKANYVAARYIINGTDKAELIAGYARQFAEIIAHAKTAAIS